MPRTARQAAAAMVVGAFSLISACGGGNDTNGNESASTNISASADNTNALANDLSGQLGARFSQSNGVMELTISGLGTNNPTSEAKWVGQSNAFAAASRSALANGGPAPKSTAALNPLPGFLDIARLTTSTIDNGGVRYIAATFRVRNAPFCGAPAPAGSGGTCTPYANARQNVTFMAVKTAPGSTISDTAVSTFRRFDGSPANPALALQVLPAHGMDSGGLVVNPNLASLQVFTEGEVGPGAVAFDPGVTSMFPYGFVVRNVNDGSRVLPANPINGRYDGIVTFGFKIPIQPLATDNPFSISLLFQSVDDLNTRVTQSYEELGFAGDIAATSRAVNLASVDLAVLGAERVHTPIGNPICAVRTAGTVDAPTAFLVNLLTPVGPRHPTAVPMNLSFVDRASSVSVGYCENMVSPTAATWVVEGSQSGRRVVGGSGAGGGGYGGTLTGGGASLRRNQLVWDITGQRNFFPGEEVRYSVTAGNQTLAGFGTVPVVGSFRIKGSIAPSLGSFGTPVHFSAGAGPLAVVLGDLNGDGILDAVTANSGSNTVSVLIGSGGGGFTIPSSFAVGTNPQSVALGDLNGDGRLDIVAANLDSSNVSILLGNGAGGFAPASNFAAGSGPQAVALGDMNGDGRLDIVIGNRSGQVNVLLGGGAGAFGPANSFALSADAWSVALGDFNGDGRLDIVTANFSTAPFVNNVSVLLNNGAGGFLTPSNFTVGFTPISVALGDMNGDGKIDIIAANSNSSSVSVLLGNGGGGFGAASDFGVLAKPVSVALGDVNGDGRLDIVTANNGSASVSVLLGKVTGGFAAATNFNSFFENYSLALGDTDGDGRLDIVTSNSGFGATNVSVMRGF